MNLDVVMESGRNKKTVSLAHGSSVEEIGSSATGSWDGRWGRGNGRDGNAIRHATDDRGVVLRISLSPEWIGFLCQCHIETSNITILNNAICLQLIETFFFFCWNPKICASPLGYFSLAELPSSKGKDAGSARRRDLCSQMSGTSGRLLLQKLTSSSLSRRRGGISMTSTCL